MHEYYAKNAGKFKKAMHGLLKPIKGELEQLGGKPYEQVFEDIWTHYEQNMLERFPYIGGDDVSGTENLTGAYCFVSMGEVLKAHGVELEEIGRLMTLAYERRFSSMPGIVKAIARKSFSNPKKMLKKYQKKDAQNHANALRNPGSFETETQVPPEEGYDFSYHNLVCPLADFARAYGYEEYMPYLCNLDYVMFGVLGLPLMREHTCFEDGDYCDFKVRYGAEPFAWWPPVFTQGKGFK